MADRGKGSSLRRWNEKVADLFGADLRSLAILRIVLASLVLVDTMGRAMNLYAHYTDDGVLPRSVLLREVLSSSAISLNLMNGGIAFQVVIFSVLALAAAALLLGYRTRLMTVLVWVLIVSVQWRNPLVLNASDTLLRLLLFWAMFLPLGAVWSIDSLRRSTTRQISMRFVSVATLGLYMQIVFVYWFTALLKDSPEWRVDGTALYYALSYDHVARPLGEYLLNFPVLLKVLTFGSLGLEAFAPFLLFVPFFTGPLRTLGVFAFVGFQAGIWLTMNIGLFQWVSALCMVCFLPAWFWYTLERLRATRLRQPDAARRLQRVLERSLQAFWPSFRTFVAGTFRSPSALGAVAQGTGQVSSTFIANENAQANVHKKNRKGKAQAKTSNSSGKDNPPSGTGGGMANSSATELRTSLAANVLALFALLYVFGVNMGSVTNFTIPERVAPLGGALGLNQGWSMFAPRPPTEGGWYVIPGELDSGKRVDLMNVVHDDFSVQEGVSWEKPESVISTYEDKYWRKYLESIKDDENEDQRLYFGQYLCHAWNTRHAGSNQVMTFEIAYMSQDTLPNGGGKSEPERDTLWTHSCF